MKLSTLERLICPIPDCKGTLAMASGNEIDGSLQCKKCKESFPILAGVAVLVPNPFDYLLAHTKGVSRWVRDQQIPASIRKEYISIKKELQTEHIEEDLESDRVNALYFMTHYLTATQVLEGIESPEIAELVSQCWDRGPFAAVHEWLGQISKKAGPQKIVELGCGVGGLARFKAGEVSNYLGVDNSFSSIALARAIHLDPNSKWVQGLPSDLIQGALARKFTVQSLNLKTPPGVEIDFVVGNFEHPPIRDSSFDGSVVLNAIDMMDDPSSLPTLQKRLVKKGGFAIQAAPYIWHEQVLPSLQSHSGVKNKNSAQTIEELYLNKGFKILESKAHLPWVFFKHLRQVELYSVHAFLAQI